MEEEKKEVKKETKNTPKDEKAAEKKTTVKKEEKVVKAEKVEKTEKVEPKKEEKKPEVKTQEKFKTKQPEKKKTNTALFIGIAAVIILVILAGAAYMMFMVNSPKKSVDGLLNALKAGDYQKANDYINYEEMMNSSDLLDNGTFDEETQKLLFDKMTWKINQVTENKDQATVEVEVTNKDFKILLGNYMQKALKAAFTGKSEQEIQTYFIEELKNENVAMATVVQSVSLVKQDGKWRVANSGDFVLTLLPGFNEAINSLT